ncbi:hypothetical protein MP228_008378 [Amoeboaphelidium protococcarum]|nr:hypothetical protein MP228_008378 [Amoeboaphelidium protococcarum]
MIVYQKLLMYLLVIAILIVAVLQSGRVNGKQFTFAQQNPHSIHQAASSLGDQFIIDSDPKLKAAMSDQNRLGVSYNESTRIFHIRMQQSSYVIRVTEDGQLENLHWGGPVESADDIQYLNKDYEAKSFDAGNKNARLSEYSDYGTGDYRIPSFRLKYSDDGSFVSSIRYLNHSIGDHVDIPDYIPHFRSNVNGSDSGNTIHQRQQQVLTIWMQDQLKGLTVKLVYQAFLDLNLIARHVEIINNGHHDVTLHEINSFTADLPPASYDGPYHFTHLSGSWGRERQMVSHKLDLGVVGIESRRGASSSQHNPFMVVSRGELNENFGEHYAFALVYASSFKAQVEINQYQTLRVQMGIHPETFEWTLKPGEQFQSPQSLLGYSQNGMGPLSRDMHRLIRRAILPSTNQSIWSPEKPRPVLVNSWEAMYFFCSEEAIMERLVEPATKLGIDMVVLDDGWFLNRNDDKHSLGDWFVDKDKFPNGLDGLSKKIHDKGLLFGIWMEPEMVSVQSRLYQEHPDWCLHVNGRNRTESRNQLVLDLSRVEVQDFIVQSVSRVLRESSADYLKWDFNRDLTEIGSNLMGAENQGKVLHMWTLGLYKVFHRLTSAFPHVLFETCSGGGNRYDLAMMYYSSQIWTSDNTDAIARTQIQWGSSLAYPFNVMSAHVSAVPNHQLQRSTPLSSRHFVAMSGMLGYELDLAALDEREQEAIKKYIQLYKSVVEPVVLNGDLYRLSSPFPQARVNQVPQLSSWMVVLPDKTQAVVYSILVSWHELISRSHRIKLQGLDAKLSYKVVMYQRQFASVSVPSFKAVQLGTRHGSTLMNAGLIVELLADADAFLFHLQIVSS